MDPLSETLKLQIFRLNLLLVDHYVQFSPLILIPKYNYLSWAKKSDLSNHVCMCCCTISISVLSIHFLKFYFFFLFQEYLLADKNMSILPVAFSLMASFMSAITLLGVSSENYTYGFQFIIINISYGIFTPVAAYLYLPVFFKLQATSAYEVSIF